MAMKLLDYVQAILSSMEGDRVNTITESEESLSVAEQVRSTYFSLHTLRDWKTTQDLLEVTSLESASTPTHFLMADNSKRLDLLNYDMTQEDNLTRVQFNKVHWKYPDQFLRDTNGRDNTAGNIDLVIDLSGVKLLIRNDANPTFYTSFNDSHIVMDSYNSVIDPFLQTDKTQAVMFSIPPFTLDDNFIPDLPLEGEPLLLAEAKSTAMFNHKQVANVKVEQEVQKLNSTLSRKQWRIKGGVRYPNYGRRRRK